MSDVPLMTAVPEMRAHECRHCRTRFRPTDGEAEFCCSGCRFVFDLLHKRGLSDFYHYGESLSPAGGFVFHERDYGWLAALQKAAEGAEVAEVDVEVQGISCAACVWLLEAVFMEKPGAVSCRIDSSAGVVRLRWRTGEADLCDYARDVQRFGYLLGPPRERGMSALRPLTRKLGLCGFFAMNAMLFASPRYFGMDPGDAMQALFDLISFALATASIVVGGTYFFRRALTALRYGQLHIDLPISLGLLLGYGGSVAAWLGDQHSLNYFDFVSVFSFLMLLGRWLQERAMEANRRRLLGLRISPGRVRLLDAPGGEAEASALRKGRRYEVARNRVVPVRSLLLHRGAAFALNWINGEPAPRIFSAGDIVPSGARSLDDESLQLQALEDWETSRLRILLHIDSERGWRNLGLEKLMKIYLAAVFAVAAAGFLAWGVGMNNWLQAFQVMISVLVVSCPCSLGVALPLLDDMASVGMQQHGVYIREGSLWARLKHVKVLLFDKTGTVTLETLRPSNPEAIDALSSHEQSVLLRMVGRSLHPAAACLREMLLSRGVESAPGGADVREIPGMGLVWETEGGEWRLGRASWAVSGDTEGGSIFAFNGMMQTRFNFREAFRPDAARQVQLFQTAGLPVYLLSGDDPPRVTAAGHTLGLPANHALGGLSPDDKAALIRRRWKDCALMLGDGANDSLAFDAVLCRGTPAVDAGLLEHKADFYMPGSGLGGLGALFASARSRRRAAQAVFAFALAYNTAAVSVALAGWMNPLVAAVIMPASSLISISLALAVFRISSSTRP